MENIDENVESVETQEVAEPEIYDIESAENQEVAEPDTEVENEPETEPEDETEVEEESNEPDDSAWAEMRREKEQFERENADMKTALSRYFDGSNPEELSAQAQAYQEQRPVEDVIKERQVLAEHENLLRENETLKGQIENATIEKMMAKGLETIQKLDPSVKSLDDLGETFANLIGAGVNETDAYYATKLRESKEKVSPPSNIGKVGNSVSTNDLYTSKELDNLSTEEINANWDKVQKSMSRL